MPFADLVQREITFEAASTGRMDFPRGGGVYLLTDREDRFIQLAAAADLRRALAGKLLDVQESPPDDATPHPGSTTQLPVAPAEDPGVASPKPMRPRLRLSEIVRHIRWWPAHSQFELSYEYLRLARVLMPDDYLGQVTFGPCWFLHVRPQDAIPRFTVGKTLRADGGVELGPIPTQADAGRLVQILEDAFDLCRYVHILAQVPHGQACSYFDMGRCPAPCDGTIPMSQYRETIEAAVQFARGDRRPLFDRMTRDMTSAAADRAYERASQLKQRLDRARGIEHEAYRFMRPVDDFNYLILQRGSTRSKTKPFFVLGGAIQPGREVGGRKLATAAAEWFEYMRSPLAREPHLASAEAGRASPDASAASLAGHAPAPRARTENIRLIAHFLFKRGAPGVFLHDSQITDTGEVLREARRMLRPSGAPPAETGRTAG
jgi:hypothetical protein